MGTYRKYEKRDFVRVLVNLRKNFIIKKEGGKVIKELSADYDGPLLRYDDNDSEMAQQAAKFAGIPTYEHVFTLFPRHPCNIQILMYTSVDSRTGKTRSVGEDAIRFVILRLNGGRMYARKTARNYRTTNAMLNIEERLRSDELAPKSLREYESLEGGWKPLKTKAEEEQERLDALAAKEAEKKRIAEEEEAERQQAFEEEEAHEAAIEAEDREIEKRAEIDAGTRREAIEMQPESAKDVWSILNTKAKRYTGFSLLESTALLVTAIVIGIKLPQAVKMLFQPHEPSESSIVNEPTITPSPLPTNKPNSERKAKLEKHVNRKKREETEY